MKDKITVVNQNCLKQAERGGEPKGFLPLFFEQIRTMFIITHTL